MPPPAEAPAPAPPVVAELTGAERALRTKLEAVAGHLGGLGERSVEKHWELADAADTIATTWEAMGYSIERQGYDVDEVVAQNLEVSVAGGKLGRESLIVGAHYDTPAGARFDNASGVAALLVLSEMFREVQPARRVRFVAYALGEPPHFGQDSMGSLRHARKIAAEGEAVIGMVSLDSIGHFSEQPSSQRTPPGLDMPLPTVGNFLLMLGTKSAGDLSRTLSTGCSRQSGVELISRTRQTVDEPALESDDWPYQRLGVPAVVVTDTRQFRASPRDPKQLDYDRMARFVSCFEKGLELLATPPDAQQSSR